MLVRKEVCQFRRRKPHIRREQRIGHIGPDRFEQAFEDLEHIHCIAR